MDLNFEIFMIVLLVLSIVVVGNFMRDGESNVLEGGLLVVSLDSLEVRSSKLTLDVDCLLHYRCCCLVLSQS